jgi:alpha-glucosidase
VDETLNELFDEGYTVPIVVGIDNGGSHRIDEYTPWINTEYGGGEGEKYMQFVVETLKPYIDQNFRTLPGRETTGIMGSSLGGLISHFGALKYPEIFGKAGIFSPSYWFSDSVWSFTASTQTGDWLRVYQMCGTAEGSNTDVNMLRMSDSLISIGLPSSNIQNKMVPGGQHNEALWRENFREAFLFLFGGSSFSVEEKSTTLPLQLSPNPSSTYFRINNQNIGINDSIVINDLNGKIIFTGQFRANESIDITRFEPGTYIVRLITQQATYESKLIKPR